MFRGFVQRLGQGVMSRQTRSFCKFVRDRPHLNVGTIGHVDHGKTTLTSAITKIASEKGMAAYQDYKQIDKTKEEQQRGITISTTTVEYMTDKRHYGHVDCPGHEDYVKNMITGAAKMDAGILVVAATDGAMPQTREHILLCKQVGVKTIIVFINKCDLVKDPEMFEIIEMDVRDLLTKYGFDGANAKFVKGSALLCLEGKDPEMGQKKIEELLNVMDNDIPVPEREVDKPFLMSIESTFNIKGRGTVVTGTIEQGKAKVGEEVEILGYGPNPTKTTITGIETFRKQLDRGEAGDNIGLLLRGVTRKNANRGMIICKPGSKSVGQCFQAQIYLLKEEEGGRKSSFNSGFKPQVTLSLNLDLHQNRRCRRRYRTSFQRQGRHAW